MTRMSPAERSAAERAEERRSRWRGGRTSFAEAAAQAVGYHDRPRTAKDLDILLVRALLEFGAHVDIAAHLEAVVDDEVVSMGHPPVRVDLLKYAPGVNFAEAWV